MHFNDTKLIDVLRQKQAEYTTRLCVSFVKNYPSIIARGRKQIGETSYYRKRGSKDSKLDPDKTIREQFNLLRVVDNEHYPAYFEFNDRRYVFKIKKE